MTCTRDCLRGGLEVRGELVDLCEPLTVRPGPSSARDDSHAATTRTELK